jgi:hypothetical protein
MRKHLKNADVVNYQTKRTIPEDNSIRKRPDCRDLAMISRAGSPALSGATAETGNRPESPPTPGCASPKSVR